MESVERIRQVIHGQTDPIMTPFYLFDELIIEKNYNSMRSLLDEARCQFSIAYSIKTNPFGSILSKLKDCGAWAEATSKLEIKLAERWKFPQIIYNGIYKPDEEIVYAAQIGAIVILDGKQQISRIEKIATKSSKPINIGIRISSYPILNDNGVRFGIYANDLELTQLIKGIASHQNIDFCCLHMHLGTNIGDPVLYKLSLDKLFHVSSILKCSGVNIRFFDLGGGMPCNPDSNWERIFRDGIYSLSDIVSDPQKTLIIEPGRALVESSGFLITRVVDLRKRIDVESVDIIVDVGTNNIMGKIFNIVHDCYELKPRYKGDVCRYRLVGPLCSSDDIILDSYEGGRIEIGDLLLISGVGAYDFSTAYQFSGNCPGVYVLKKDGQLKCIKEGGRA